MIQFTKLFHDQTFDFCRDNISFLFVLNFCTVYDLPNEEKKIHRVETVDQTFQPIQIYWTGELIHIN